ncbi:MAG: VOC family protein [Actinomycetota bacterium]
MTLHPDFLTIDAADPQGLARFWEEALTSYEILEQPSDEPDPGEEVVLLPVDRKGPKVLFIKVDDRKVVKNRLHLDLRPETGGDRDAEVARLEALGATRVDIGQGDVSWVVMADPEGNEFCVLRALTAEEAERYSDWAW